jgi:ABC-type methionine transport system ATPase subunit
MNLQVNENESVALVGHSGSGKSTIASLLLRYYNKESGSVQIDGMELEHISVKQLRKQIAIVMQEPILFNESIKENIRYGNSTANDQDIFQAAEQANCLSFIQNSVDALVVPEVKR